MARGGGGGGGNKYQQMANQRDAMMQKLIDSLDANTKAVGNGAGGGAGGSGGGAAALGVPSPQARAPRTSSTPLMDELNERNARLDKIQADSHSATMQAMARQTSMASQLVSGLGGGLATGLAAAAPGFLATTINGATQPLFAGLDARKRDFMESEENAKRRAGSAVLIAESEQRYEAGQTRLKYGIYNKDADEQRGAAADLRQEIKVQRSIHQADEAAIEPEIMARRETESRLDRAARAGAFHGGKNKDFLQKVLDFQAQQDAGVVVMRQMLRGMTAQKDRSLMRNK